MQAEIEAKKENELQAEIDTAYEKTSTEEAKAEEARLCAEIEAEKVKKLQADIEAEKEKKFLGEAKDEGADE